MDRNNYTEEDILNIYIEGIEEFKRENPLFIDSKVVYAPTKKSSQSKVAKYFEVARKLHAKYPQVLAGFDLVGQEDTVPGILTFIENILELPADLKFFFHAGETNWFGSVDENLVNFKIYLILFNIIKKNRFDLFFVYSMLYHCRLMRFC